MRSRPLVPALFATVIGILVDHYILNIFYLPVFFLPLIIIILAGLSFILPANVRNYWFLLVFILLGIYFSHGKSTLSELPPVANMDKEVIIEGTVYRQPKVRGSIAKVLIHGEKIFSAKEYKAIEVNLQLKIYKYRGVLKPGDKIRFPAILREFKNFNNPGRFNYKFYMENLGISFMAVTRNGKYVVPMGKGDLGIIENALERARGPVRNFLNAHLPFYSCPIYKALILGERQEITNEIRAPFDRAGVGHIMAVSGLHLGLVAWFFFKFTKWLLSLSYRLTLMVDIKKLAAIITTVPVITYGLITGLQVSSQRAMIMVLVFLWSFIIGREKDVWSSLSIAAIVVLSLNGDALFTTSFQLSFITVAGILYLSPLILSWLLNIKNKDDLLSGRRKFNPILSYTAGLIAVTTSATIVTIPLMSYYFHRLSVISLLANLTVVPIVGLWVLPFGLLSAVTLFFSSALAGVLLAVGELGLNIAVYLVHFWSDIPWASISVIQPNIFEILLIYILTFLIINIVRSRLSRLFFIFFLIICCTDIGYWIYQAGFTKNLEVTVLSMARGSAAFIKYPGKKNMLIAYDVFSSKGLGQGRSIIGPYLWQKKVGGLDCLFLPNCNKLSKNRLNFIINNFHPGEIIFDLQGKKIIGGVELKGYGNDEVGLAFNGWYVFLNKQKIEIKKKKIEKSGKLFINYLVIKKEKIEKNNSIPALSLKKTGALTININPKGDLKIKCFLKNKENLNRIRDY